VADEAVTDATARVYSDSHGITEITPDLVLGVPSAVVPSANEQGIVEVDVSGLQADTLVYAPTATVTVSGTEPYPQTAPHLAVRTAIEPAASAAQIQAGAALRGSYCLTVDSSSSGHQALGVTGSAE
jgi:hypothetical protein